MNIVILEAYHSNPGDLSWDSITRLGNVTIHERTSQDQIISRCVDADIIVTNKLKVTREVMDQLPKLKLIHQLATGTDNIDKVAASEKGITVRNAVGYSTHAVSQHTFALILELFNHVGIHDRETKGQGWTKSGDWCHMIATPRQLYGKTLGIIGFGKIGQAVANIGLAFGMTVVVYSNHASQNQYPSINLVDLKELAELSDVVTIHAPLTADNKNIIDKSFLARMKPSSILINTARGGHIVESDLYDALKSGAIRGAGLDVMDHEPPESDNPLLQLDNCIVTSHMAWTAYESRKALIEIVAKGISDFIQGT
ncbi:D-2-hydroxyacid dehydrogenase [Marinoscillum sp. MHG1-6]|uniref:D-2-hydroxyacid dehydrogenase n=1 Tax=Marinoscillum sp. MHG1-6 TaxID=2959627 RepID=UPI0021583AC6|nr:D-2-hydroxyacid dehydrogenase [Marinoscillum sp. MHG1-6]